MKNLRSTKGVKSLSKLEMSKLLKSEMATVLGGYGAY